MVLIAIGMDPKVVSSLSKRLGPVATYNYDDLTQEGLARDLSGIVEQFAAALVSSVQISTGRGGGPLQMPDLDTPLRDRDVF